MAFHILSNEPKSSRSRFKFAPIVSVSAVEEKPPEVDKELVPLIERDRFPFAILNQTKELR